MHQTVHPYWGNIKADWAGFSAGKKFSIPLFEKEVPIFLGEEFDKDGEEIDMPPMPAQLAHYAQTFQQFLDGANEIIGAIKQATFERYQSVYAHHYENATVSGEAALGIDTAEKHFEWMRDLGYIRMLDGGAMKAIIHYKLDEEHGLEIKLVGGKIADIGGIAET